MPSNLIQLSGPLGWILVTMGLTAFTLALLLPLVVGLARWRLPASVGWIAITATVVLAAGGTAYFRQQTFTLPPHDSPDMVQAMLASSLSVMLYPAIIGLLAGGLALYAAGWATALPAPFRPGPTPHRDGKGLLLAVVGGALGLMVAGVVVRTKVGLGSYTSYIYSLALLLLALLAGLPPVLSALRIDARDRAEQARMAGLRVATGMSLGLAIGLLNEAIRLLETVTTFQAVAVETPDRRASLLASNMEFVSALGNTGWTLALIPLLAGLFSSFIALRRADKWTAVGFGLAITQILLILGSLGYMMWVVHDAIGRLV